MFCFVIIIPGKKNKYPCGKNQRSVFIVYLHNPSCTKGIGIGNMGKTLCPGDI